jgi:hypothetical protein
VNVIRTGSGGGAAPIVNPKLPELGKTGEPYLE